MSQNLLTASNSHCRVGSFSRYPQTRLEKSRRISLSLKPFTLRIQPPRTHFPNLDFLKTRQRYVVRAFELEATEKTVPDKRFDFDTFLSVLEFLCLASSAAASIAVAVNSWVFRQQNWVGFRFLVAQCAVLAGGMLIGAVIRRRQWRRICNVDFSKSSKGSEGFNFVERIEKLEEESRGSMKIIRVLSRQLEKLGTRFRIKMRSLKDPIMETAALAQKNSEATRALAVEGETLEKEFVEIQNILLAMQDQQQKQLELILAIGKISKSRDIDMKGPCQDHSQSQDAPPNTTNSAVEEVPDMILN
ncbi:unnamed protein product [Cuscuta europaea]|uniref:Uncharacterized protein n=1 Tax=Cuscuta europaea TaxID=41803 RepID=A0A9P0ZL60_CUSEU|nr:unnamed protein product [Cuscuta europaea]